MSENGNVFSNEYHPFQKWKVLCHYDRMKTIKTGNFDPPVNIAIDLISGTNKKKMCGGFKCSMCMSDLGDNKKCYEVPDDILYDIPQFYAEWNVKSICIAGEHSDPLMIRHSKLIKFLRLCLKNGIEIGLVSNGYNYTKKLMEEVARACKWSGFSINAGTEIDHEMITGKKGAFKKILANIKYISDYVKEYDLQHTIGYKFLITDENYKYIFNAVENAKKNGATMVQIRPCELSIDKINKIDIKEVNRQVNESLKLANDNFDIYSVREKFTLDLKKKAPKRCIASPLGSTWLASGEIAPCPDRRWSVNQPNMSLGNFITEGLEAIRRKWGGVEHKKMIEECNNRINECIRCTSFAWNELYENTITNDLMDLNLI